MVRLLTSEAVGKIPCNERVWIDGDLNGHVGEGNTGEEVFMGRFGLGVRNAEGNRIVEFAQRMEMAIVNTFEKRKEHKITYKSGGREAQIDYLLCRRNLKAVMDYKIFPGESVTSQHRAVV